MPSVCRRALLLSLPASLLAVMLARDSLAARPPKIQWSVDGLTPAQASLEKHLLNVLRRESRRASWGSLPSGTHDASVKILVFQLERKPDVVRITCTAVGRLESGPLVKTHFSFGGHLNREAALQSQMLLLVGRGIVTRLSSISRERHPPRP